MDIQTTKKVARLARIGITDEQAEVLSTELSNIIGFVEQLSEVDTENVAPLANVVEIDAHIRKDEINDGGYPEKVLANAPEETQNFFGVPKVVE